MLASRCQRRHDAGERPHRLRDAGAHHDEAGEPDRHERKRKRTLEDELLGCGAHRTLRVAGEHIDGHVGDVGERLERRVRRLYPIVIGDRRLFAVEQRRIGRVADFDEIDEIDRACLGDDGGDFRPGAGPRGNIAQSGPGEIDSRTKVGELLLARQRGHALGSDRPTHRKTVTAGIVAHHPTEHSDAQQLIDHRIVELDLGSGGVDQILDFGAQRSDCRNPQLRDLRIACRSRLGELGIGAAANVLHVIERATQFLFPTQSLRNLHSRQIGERRAQRGAGLRPQLLDIVPGVGVDRIVAGERGCERAALDPECLGGAEQQFC